MNVSHQHLNFEITKKIVSRGQQSAGHCVASHAYDSIIDLMDGFGINTACLAWGAARYWQQKIMICSI